MALPQPEVTAKRVAALQAELRRRNIDGLFLMICMPYEGESVKGETLQPTENHIAYLTNFDGSAGMMVVTQNAAAMFVDGRYTEAAARLLAGTTIEACHYAQKPWTEWLRATKHSGPNFAADFSFFSAAWIKDAKAKLQGLGLTLQHCDDNPVDAIWADKPALQLKMAEVFDESLAGESSASKRQRLGLVLSRAGAAAALITEPQGVAWLLNIRGTDLVFENTSTTRIMVVLSQLLLRADGSAIWFVEPERVDDAVRAHLGSQVTIAAPSTFAAVIAELKNKTLMVDKDTCSAYLAEVLQQQQVLVQPGLCPVAEARAIKNTTELDGFRAAHRRDAVAYAKFLRWYDENVTGGTSQCMEADIIKKMASLRAESNAFRASAFGELCGFAENGADIHYHTSAATDRPLQGNSLLIFDSGGQYDDGTTDITRVLPVGVPTDAMRDHYTLVLKGHIALAMLKFPAGTSGHRIDAFTRQYLWQAGLDFDHGTGHGVGHVLSVHEGPQRISFVPNLYPLQAGMVVSNEPGFYKTGAGGYGIRIENLMAIVPAPEISHERTMLQCETLTLVPLARGLINKALLTAAEIAWVDAYHARVVAEIGPLVPAAEQAYLQQVCAPL